MSEIVSPGEGLARATDTSPHTPEARAQHGHRARKMVQAEWKKLGPGSRVWEIAKRVLVGVYSDGFIHAGNLAYLSLMTVFPFFITTAAIASIFGQSEEARQTVVSFLNVLPPDVASLLQKPISDVLSARTGNLLLLGGLVGLWTVGSFIETIRDIFRRAYGTVFSNPFWRYRLSSVAVIVGSVILALLSFLIQGVLTAAEQFIYRLLPFAEGVAGWVGISRAIPGLVMFGALYMLFYSVTPSKYRYSSCPKWPGALFTAAWWVTMTAMLPKILSLLGGYDLTYGSLAGVVVMLLFFFLIGLGIVFGAHLNAALAEPPATGVDAAETGEAVEAGAA